MMLEITLTSRKLDRRYGLPYSQSCRLPHGALMGPRLDRLGLGHRYGAMKMKAELQEVMNMLRKLQGSIDFGATPAAEREELAEEVSDIMDALFEAMKKMP